MPRKSPYQIMLTPHERETLQSWAGKYTLLYYRVMRAKMILLAADVVSNDQNAHKLDMPRKTINQLRKRFYEASLAGLEDQPRCERPPDFFPSSRCKGESVGLWNPVEQGCARIWGYSTGELAREVITQDLSKP